MNGIGLQWADHFRREIVRSDHHAVLRSTCKACGEVAISARLDGTVLKWEESHAARCLRRDFGESEDSPARLH